VLQCASACCSVAASQSRHVQLRCVLQCVEVCCNVLQCVAELLQRAAACCSVVQRVAACCSVAASHLCHIKLGCFCKHQLLRICTDQLFCLRHIYAARHLQNLIRLSPDQTEAGQKKKFV